MKKTDPNRLRRKAAASAITAGLLIGGPITGTAVAAADEGPPEPGQSEFQGPGDGPIEPGQHEFRGLGDNKPRKRKRAPGISFWGS